MIDPAQALYLIDGHSLTFKAYYAIRGLTTPDGRPTGAVFGFLRMLLKYFDDYRPSHIAVVFDTGKPTFRNALYDQYKANREAPPPDFGQQMEWIVQLLGAMGIAQYQLDGYEADDLIGTMAEQAKAQGHAVSILTADKDLFQLVDEQVTMLRPGTNTLERFGPAEVRAKLGVDPAQVIDWLALVGDSSDNIPGVPGIGPKSATQLLAEYGDVATLMARADEIKKPKQRENLIAWREKIHLSRALATVKRDVPMTWSFDECLMPAEPWTPAARQLMVDLGFQSILKERAIGGSETLTPAGARAAAPIETDYRTLTDLAALEAWAAEAMKAPWLALDTETTSTDAMQAALVGISLAVTPGRAVYIPVGHRPEVCDAPQLELDAVRQALAPLLSGRGPRLSGHHAKFDWKVLRQAGFAPAAPAFDSMIASYLLNPDRPGGHGLKSLGADLAGVAMNPITELIGSGRGQITMAEVAVADAAPYACLDADVTLRLTERLLADLEQEPEALRLLDTIEMPLLGVLLEMEMGGFNLDVPCLRGLSEQLKTISTDLTRQIWDQAGHPFNIGSPRQVAQVLFKELGLKPGRKLKTGYSTDEEELERLAAEHPIPRLILEYRGAEKLQSTYIEALPKLVNPQTGRIHTSFNQTIAATGRLSSTDPNLQNIPIRTEMGRAIRRAFIADDASHLLLKADYSQIELRILAHVSRDPALVQAYSEGRDIHRQTASEVFGVESRDVTAAMRAQAKTINFGIMYGMSPHGLATQLGINRAQAAGFIDRYFNTYPGVREWIDRMLTEARRTGYVQTLLGRRRPVPGLGEKNRMVREGAERIAVNSPIQGTCADMIKLAMIRIHRELGVAAPGARMVCQVHDELVFSVPRAVQDAAGPLVRRCMIEALPLSVPIEVDLGWGPNWAECQA